MLNQPIYDNSQSGRQPLNETVAVRAITMTFETNGSASARFSNIPFKVKEIRVISACFSDGGDPQGDYALLWADLFQTTPVCLIGTTSSETVQPISQLNGEGGSRIQYNPARDISGQINFRLTAISASQTPYTLTTSTCSACVIMEFIRGE